MSKFTYFVIFIILFSALYSLNFAISQDIDQLDETIIYGMPYDFDGSSVYTGSSYGNAQWHSAVYASLLKRSSVKHNWEPELALNLPTISNNGLTFTFTLKEDLTFSNGHELDTDDVEFSLQVALTPKVNREFYKGLIGYLNNDSINIINSQTIEFTILKPYAFAHSLLSFPIVDKQFFEDRYNRCLDGVDKDCTWNDPNGTDNVSAGPFMISDIDITNENVPVVANPFYYGAFEMDTDQIIFQKIGDKDAAIIALASGVIDILDSQYVPSLNEFVGIDGIREEFVGDPSSQQFALNHLNPYFGTGKGIPGNGGTSEQERYDDAALVRKALSHIVDREFAVDVIMEGLARPASTIMPEVSIGFDTTLIPREFSIETARNYMETAGFDYSLLGSENENMMFDNSFFEITILVPGTGPARKSWDVNFVLALPKIGIGVKEHVSTGWAEISPRTFGATDLPGSYDEGGFDIFALGYGWALDWNPSGQYEDVGRCDTGDCSNFLNFDLGENKTNLASLVRDYLSELDFDKRLDKVKLVQAEMYKWVPEIPILYPSSHWGFNEDLIGIDSLLLSVSAQDWVRVSKENFLTNIPSNGVSGESLEFPGDMRLFLGFIGGVGLVIYGVYYKYKKGKLNNSEIDDQLLEL